MTAKRGRAVSEKAGPVDLSDPADVMAVLRGASRELRRQDEKIAEAEARRAAAEQELAGVAEARAGLESELEAWRKRAADAETEARSSRESVQGARAQATTLEEELLRAQRALARSRGMLTLASSAALVCVVGILVSGQPQPVREPEPKQASPVTPSAPSPGRPAPQPDFAGLGPPREVKTVKVAPRSRAAQTAAQTSGTLQAIAEAQPLGAPR